MNVGFIGIGSIAATMAKELQQIEGAELVAVYGRNKEKAKQFSSTYQVPKFTNDLAEFYQYPEVELVYIATPHIHHYVHAKKALQQGKHVFCEKPLTMSKQEAAELFDLAKENNLFLAEAFWTRFNPLFKKLLEIEAAKTIGKFKSLITNIGGNGLGSQRLVDPELGGGALMDVGVYGLNLMLHLFGPDYSEYQTIVNKGATGVDIQHTLCYNFHDSSAVLNATIQSETLNGALISGEEGYIVIDHLSEFNQIEVYRNDRERIHSHRLPEKTSGYRYE